MAEIKLYNIALERAVFRQIFPDKYGKSREYILSQLLFYICSYFILFIVFTIFRRFPSRYSLL